jgi:hypothetical protein
MSQATTTTTTTMSQATTTTTMSQATTTTTMSQATTTTMRMRMRRMIATIRGMIAIRRDVEVAAALAGDVGVQVMAETQGRAHQIHDKLLVAARTQAITKLMQAPNQACIATMASMSCRRSRVSSAAQASANANSCASVSRART